MSLVSLNDILPKAKAEGYAVGAFNIANYETAVAVITAAEAENQPVIMQIYQRLMEDPFLPSLAAMMCSMAERSTVPVAIHLDHGASFEQVKLAIDCGFTSVMFDGSQLPFEENLKQTMEAAAYARSHNVSIEGEIGHVPLNGVEGAEKTPLSTPEEAQQFAEQTGVDALAVAIGTAHGYYREEPVIDVELAKAISAAVDIPLVLHGGSGTPQDKVKEVIRNGFAKVNVATEFQHALQLSIEREMKKLNGGFLPLDKLVKPAVEDAVNILRDLIKMFSQPV